MFHLTVDYPEVEDEVTIVKKTTSSYTPEIEPVMDAQRILELQDLVRKVPISDEVVRFAVDLVRRTRPDGSSAPDYVKEFISWGAGPRASQYLVIGGKARAILDGRLTVSNEDIKALALPILRHRMLTNFQAEAQGLTTDDIVKRLMEES